MYKQMHDGLTNRFSYHLVMLFQDPQAQAVRQFLVIILHRQHRIARQPRSQMDSLTLAHRLHDLSNLNWAK